MSDFLTCFGKNIDCIRSIHDSMGTRPYSVYIVKSGWSEGHVNEGIAQELSRIKLEPTPRLETLNALTSRYEPCGEVFDGQLRISEISPQYERFEIEPNLLPGQTRHLEIHFNRSNGDAECSIDLVSWNLRNVPGWSINATVRKYDRG